MGEVLTLHLRMEYLPFEIKNRSVSLKSTMGCNTVNDRQLVTVACLIKTESCLKAKCEKLVSI